MNGGKGAHPMFYSLCFLLSGLELSLGESPALMAARDALAGAGPIRFEAETSTVVEGNPPSDIPRRQLTRCTFARDGERMGALVKTWLPDERGAFDHDHPHLAFQAVWTGERFLYYKSAGAKPQSVGRGITSARRETGILRVMGTLGGGEALDGYLPGDQGLKWPAILRDARELRESTEQNEGTANILLDGLGAYGRYRIWLDPQGGHTVRRIEVIKTNDDLLDGRPVREARLSSTNARLLEYRLTVDKVKYQRVGSKRIPVSAFIESTASYQNAVTVIWQHQHKRKQVVVGDDANVDEVLLLQAPEGSRFSDMDGTNDVYIWQAGQLNRHEWIGKDLVPKP